MSAPSCARREARLTEHFTLREMLDSATAARLCIDNEPREPAIVARLAALCRAVLQPLREGLGRPVRVVSGYRAPALNRAVNGSPMSQHMAGEAADIVVDGLSPQDVAAWIMAAPGLEFDQLIIEPSWTHVSFTERRPNRRQLLTQTPRGPRARTAAA